jgi:superfamily II DNA/RNA helicase
MIYEKNVFPVIVYSNFLSAGVEPLFNYIKQKHPKIKMNILDGRLSPPQKQGIINDYNRKRIKILFITSAASEGVDFKNTRQIHIMEPHWNFAKINQVIGRGVRYRSHVNLNESERNVQVFNWISVLKSNQGYSADQYLVDLSEKKTHFINIFENILQHGVQFINLHNLSNNNSNNNSNSEYSISPTSSFTVPSSPTLSFNSAFSETPRERSLNSVLPPTRSVNSELPPEQGVVSVQRPTRSANSRNNPQSIPLQDSVKPLTLQDFPAAKRQSIAALMARTERPLFHFSRTSGKLKIQYKK